MASVPTGMPAGICTIDSSESWPDSAFDSTGTPNTGSGVIDGGHARQVRGAAGAGDDDLRSRHPCAPLAKATSRSGVRWAETIRAS